MHIVFAPDIQASDYTLNKEESYHIIKVLRKRIDDKITLIDGKGNFYSALITYNDPKACTVKIIETHKDIERGFSLHIAIAPAKNIDRFEWFVEKTVEIGIDEITPMICSRSERKTLRLDRLEKICISAVKQSIKATLPKFNPPALWKDVIQSPTSAQKFIATCEENSNNHLKTKYNKGNDALILIGPEGDFSPEEIAVSIKYDFESVSLGASRLRTETAGIVACHTINLINNI
jgi:16S rRNA (uracil1498-N3)-methyltransferase